MTSFSSRSRKYRSLGLARASSSFSSGAWRYMTLSASEEPSALSGIAELRAGGCSDVELWGVRMPCPRGPVGGCTSLRSGMSPSWMPRARAAMSELIREPAMKEPRIEKASSSSAAALTLALSSGRSDSFSSIANVVPEVMLLPSKLGGLVPSSELESHFCDSSDPLSLLIKLRWRSGAELLPSTTRLGTFGPSFRPWSAAEALSTSADLPLGAVGMPASGGEVGCERGTTTGALLTTTGFMMFALCSALGVWLVACPGEGRASFETDAAT